MGSALFEADKIALTAAGIGVAAACLVGPGVSEASAGSCSPQINLDYKKDSAYLNLSRSSACNNSKAIVTGEVFCYDKNGPKRLFRVTIKGHAQATQTVKLPSGCGEFYAEGRLPIAEATFADKWYWDKGGRTRMIKKSAMVAAVFAAIASPKAAWKICDYKKPLLVGRRCIGSLQKPSVVTARRQRRCGSPAAETGSRRRCRRHRRRTTRDRSPK
ncbi:hypothetical protein [Rhodococcus jostii]|uniref:hypothetical protein n=1 Tax=Rhodococcus jostii TaxID=132919 RepID=UPI003666304F